MREIVCLLLIIISLSTGCTSLYKVDEDKVKDVSDIITDVLINTAGQEKAERQESHTIAPTDKNTISLISSVGDISIVTHQSDDTIINMDDLQLILMTFRLWCTFFFVGTFLFKLV